MSSESLPKNPTNLEVVDLLQRMKTECEKALLSGYEEAQISGLCHDGAFEMAIGRLRSLKPEQLLIDWQTEFKQ